MPIRPPPLEHHPALLEIGRACGLFTAEELDVLLGQTLKRYAAGQLPPKHHVLAAYPSDAASLPIGWCYFAVSELTDGRVWDLWWLGVHPSAHGTGVATELVATVERMLTLDYEARTLVVETASTAALARARAFYTKSGFVQCGQIPDFYGDGEDKVLYCKRFPRPDSQPGQVSDK